MANAEKLELLEKSKQEFARRRKVMLSNIPDGVDIEQLKRTIIQDLGLNVVAVEIENKTVHLLFKNKTDAEHGVVTLKSLDSLFADKGITISFPEPDSLLFIGNLPFEVTEDQLGELMSQYGKLERVFLVRSELTGDSKGYGFAEYSDKKTAGEAKQQLLKSGAKYISGRILRVDFAEPNLHSYKDLQSKTLFLDKLPRDFTDGEVLRKLFSQSGRVTYAQVAISTQAGTSRGFAFVDYETSEEAEKGQIAHNNAKIGDSNIRTSYGTPGRSGASVLGPCTPSKTTRPVSLMSAAVPNNTMRPPPPQRPQMNPRPLMSGPMICPDPSAHMIRGCPMPLMAAGPRFWDPRAGIFPRPVGPGMYPGGGPRPPIGNPRGPNPVIAQVRGSIGHRGPSPGGLPTGEPVRPLMNANHSGMGSNQIGVSNPTNSSSLASSIIKPDRSPQPLMPSNHQQATPSTGQQSLSSVNSPYNGTPQSLLGQNTSYNNSTVPSGNTSGFTGQTSGNGIRPRAPAPLMTNDTWGAPQGSSYANNSQQYPTQSGQTYSIQNSTSYQSTGSYQTAGSYQSTGSYQTTPQSSGGYQSDYQRQDTSYSSSQSSYKPSASTESWQPQGQQQEWSSMHSQQQYNTTSGSTNNQSYGNALQPHHTSGAFNYSSGQASKQPHDSTDPTSSSTLYQTSGEMYDPYYNASKRPRY